MLGQFNYFHMYQFNRKRIDVYTPSQVKKKLSRPSRIGLHADDRRVLQPTLNRDVPFSLSNISH